MKVKVQDKEENGMVCEYATETYYGPINGTTSKDVLRNKDAFYFKEPVETIYLLDRQQEYTQVIKENDKKYVYGTTLIKEDKEDIVTGWNNSVVLKTDKEKTKKMSYNDYGISKDTTQGLGYNSEMQDATGLIYLRARYYDPKTARFVQVDNNYDGEKDYIGSQNKYAYTLGNPYKYVDRDGNKPNLKPGSFFRKSKVGLIEPPKIPRGFKDATLDGLAQMTKNPNGKRSSEKFPSSGFSSEHEGLSTYKRPMPSNTQKVAPRTFKTSHTLIAVASCPKGEYKSFGEKAKDWVIDNSEMVSGIATAIGQMAIMLAGLAAGTVAAPAVLTICGVLATVAGIIAVISGAVTFVKGVNLISQGIQNREINTVANGIGTAILGVFGVCVGWQVLEQGLTIAKSGIAAVGAWWKGRNSEGSDNGLRGEPVKIEGRGSTGRTAPIDVDEKIAMNDAMHNPFEEIPGERDVRISVPSLTDSRWTGWEKWEIVYRTSEGRNITIHFNYDPVNKLFDDFKFK